MASAACRNARPKDGDSSSLQGAKELARVRSSAGGEISGVFLAEQLLLFCRGRALARTLPCHPTPWRRSRPSLRKSVPVGARHLPRRGALRPPQVMARAVTRNLPRFSRRRVARPWRELRRSAECL